MCSKHVDARNKLIAKQKFCASSWLITKINIVYFALMNTNGTKKFQMNDVSPSKIFILFYIRSLFLRRVSINIMISHIFEVNLKSEK